MRKRSRRRPVPVRQVPIAFGFPAAVLRDAMIEARTALDAALCGRGDALDVDVLTRIALYCSRMYERMLASGEYDPDGLVPLAAAAASGLDAAQALRARLPDGTVQAFATEREPLVTLIDAYELTLRTATRRESDAAIREVHEPRGAL